LCGEIDVPFSVDTQSASGDRAGAAKKTLALYGSASAFT
jgi:hypothetical protein